jgi:hypothetical protein
MLTGFSLGKRSFAVVALLFLVLGVAATATRTIVKYQPPGPFDPTRQGMCDYHNGMFFPGRAVLDGISPYGQDYADSNPVSRQIPFFSPSILVAHTPIILLPLRAGEIVFFVMSVALMLWIALLLASQVGEPKRWDFALGLAAVMVFSRGGHITLFDGYFTFELVLATFLAIHWGDRRPWLSAIALAVVASKPTYILPLGFLMLARGNVKAIVIGAVLSIITTAAPMLWIAHHEGGGDIGKGVSILLEDISQTQEIHRAQEDESPVHSWTRMDLLAIIAKWSGDDPGEATHMLAMIAVLAPAMIVLYRRRKLGMDDGLVGVTGAIILVTMIVSIYHQSYDALLLMAPLAGLVIRRLPVWTERPKWSQLVMVGLILIPLYSYFSTRMILGRLGMGDMETKVFTSINGVCLAILFGFFLWIGWVFKGTAKSA